MDPESFDWSNNESIFIKDDAYENINAPQWIDLSAQDPPVDDDEAWFCSPDCQHPKIVKDSCEASEVCNHFWDSSIQRSKSQVLSEKFVRGWGDFESTNGVLQCIEELGKKNPIGVKKGTMEKLDDVLGDLKNRVRDREGSSAWGLG